MSTPYENTMTCPNLQIVLGSCERPNSIFALYKKVGVKTPEFLYKMATRYTSVDTNDFRKVEHRAA